MSPKEALQLIDSSWKADFETQEENYTKIIEHISGVLYPIFECEKSLIHAEIGVLNHMIKIKNDSFTFGNPRQSVLGLTAGIWYYNRKVFDCGWIEQVNALKYKNPSSIQKERELIVRSIAKWPEYTLLKKGLLI